MKSARSVLALVLLMGYVHLSAQVASSPTPATTFGEPGVSQLAPNTLMLGSGTGISYDSNALNSQPHTADTQFTFYPLIGLKLARPRWGAVVSFAPGMAYSSANLPQYQAMSLTSTAAFDYQASARLSLTLFNNFVSSSNPFASLPTSSTSGQGTTPQTSTAALNYLPSTNELAKAEAGYRLTARSSMIASLSYNYISYQHNADIPDTAQPFQTSTSMQSVVGWSYSVSPKYSESVQYLAQFLSAGQGVIKTVGQSIQYSFGYNPGSGLRLSGMIGPEYVQNTYRVTATNAILDSLSLANLSGWTWTGSLAVTKSLGTSHLSASASSQLMNGTQYQGNVRETTFQADFKKPLRWKTNLLVFASYNINEPVFLTNLSPRLSNDYASTGVTASKTIADHWMLSCAYWYLFQNSPVKGQQLYSGDHNRVAISLTYSLTKALAQ